ncbi:hypothetical protein [Celeribacter baekdonensis]|jgi:hypothetical protein|uniref:Uncharacterized protein n=1 Tax=Celeribacter baekdonensis TaxID=875171 RepID=A0A2R4M104_9RHOB|nr:hypothetical protein [Celeribacter baekdonensis]AVW90841.1 hypothetical protein DA792_06875 [Celeribacter baekdonensis]
MQLASAYTSAALIGRAQEQQALRSPSATPEGNGASALSDNNAQTAGPVQDQKAPEKPRQTGSPAPTKSTIDSAAETAKATAKSKASAANAVFARYELTQISATEIDQMTSELKTAGFDDLGFLMGLERQGATYRTEMESRANVLGYETNSGFDAEAPMDLLAKTRSERDLAHRYGQTTERLDSQLAKLEAAHMKRPSAAAPTGPSAQMAETLVLFQAQRLWIE